MYRLPVPAIDRIVNLSKVLGRSSMLLTLSTALFCKPIFLQTAIGVVGNATAHIWNAATRSEAGARQAQRWLFVVAFGPGPGRDPDARSFQE